MKIIKPIVRPKNNVLTTQPFTPDGTLVNDTVRLVNDTTALSGGNTSIVPNIKVNTRIPKIRTAVKKRR